MRFDTLEGRQVNQTTFFKIELLFYDWISGELPQGPDLLIYRRKLYILVKLFCVQNEDILLENYDPNTNYEKLGISNGEPLIYLQKQNSLF